MKVARTETKRDLESPDLTAPLGRQGPAAGWFSVVSAALFPVTLQGALTRKGDVGTLLAEEVR